MAKRSLIGVVDVYNLKPFDQASSYLQATEKIIISSSKLISKFENLELLKSSGAYGVPPSVELSTEPRPAYEIFGNLENLILYSEESEDDFFMPVVDDISHLAVVSQSVLSYIKTISPGSRLMAVSNSIHTQVSDWLSSLFFCKSSATFLPSNTECLSKALRLALTCKFNNYLQDGVRGIKGTSIYINSSNPYLPDLKFAAHLIGLSQSSIKIISSGDGYAALNVAELEKQISIDQASDVVPLFLLADLGSSFSGVVDGTVSDLSALSEKHKLWLHLTGSLIASFSIAQNQSEITKNVSSMTLDFESWLGLPSIPTVLLHKQFLALDQSVFEIENDMKKIEAFPLWTVMQNIGRDRIVASFTLALQSCKVLYEMVSKTKGFRMLSRSTPTGDDNPDELSTVTVVLFQFDGSNFQGYQADKDVVKKAIEKVDNASYFDRLNSWLGQTLERDFAQVQLSLMDHPIYGTCIRYSPFELSIGEKVPTLETFTEFNEFFEAQSDILCATIQKKQVFNDMVENSNVLRLVQLSDDWAGLGGVHYVPEHMETIETDQGKSELNKLNIQLVDKLRSSDNAFSLGESTDGIACIRFGMVTSETDIEELLDLVIGAGNALQESSKVLDSMAEVIRKGIQAVECDLKKEADEKVWNDGILRVVPVVGSMLNWINPLPKDGGSGIRGRSMNLQQGVVESTENIYKYHMQLPLNPPTNGRTSTSHSRNESQSSTNSKASVTTTTPKAPVATTTTTPKAPVATTTPIPPTPHELRINTST